MSLRGVLGTFRYDEEMIELYHAQQLVNLVTERLKDAYWDPRRYKKLKDSALEYDETLDLDETLMRDFNTEKFLMKGNYYQVQFEPVFDKKYIGFIEWLMMWRNVDKEYISLITKILKRSKNQTKSLDEVSKQILELKISLFRAEK